MIGLLFMLNWKPAQWGFCPMGVLHYGQGHLRKKYFRQTEVTHLRKTTPPADPSLHIVSWSIRYHVMRTNSLATSRGNACPQLALYDTGWPVSWLDI